MFSLLLHVDCKNLKIYGKSLLAVKCFILHDIFSAKLKMTLNSQLKFVSTYYSLPVSPDLAIFRYYRKINSVQACAA
jgi:hypothetical protein